MPAHVHLVPTILDAVGELAMPSPATRRQPTVPMALVGGHVGMLALASLKSACNVCAAFPAHAGGGTFLGEDALVSTMVEHRLRRSAVAKSYFSFCRFAAAKGRPHCITHAAAEVCPSSSGSSKMVSLGLTLRCWMTSERRRSTTQN